MPNIYAVGTDGKIADACRAIETIRVISDLYYNFQNLRSARERVRKGILASEQMKNRMAEPTPRPHLNLLVAHADDNPVRSAEVRYLQEHGTIAYNQLLQRLFDELFSLE